VNSAATMERKLTGLSRRYQAALRSHLQQVRRASPEPARSLGRRALALGLETLDLARLHERALMALTASCPGRIRPPATKRAAGFFAEAITPIEKTHLTVRDANARLNEMIETLSRRSVDLAASNRQLRREIVQRRRVEKALRKSEQHYSRLLARSQQLQDQLRHLSRQLLLAQEEERKKISRELHDEIAQTLTGINVQLADLKGASTVNTAGLQQRITHTQRLVERSVDIVHRFARELRPTMLDDLGLIPALHSFVKSLADRTGIRVRLTVFAAVEKLDNAKRTVLYRVAQEALTNVAKHAHASQATVNLQKLPGAVRLEIADNGKSFRVQQVLRARGNNRLGLLGMRERVEMVGGRFSVESAPGRGTTVRARIPLRNGERGAGR